MSKIHGVWLPEEYCIKYGVDEAILIQKLAFWIRFNQDKNEAFEDGFTWTFQTREFWAKSLPFWTEKVILRITKSLEKKGLIKMEKRRAFSGTHTLWYTIVDKSICADHGIDSPFAQTGNSPFAQTGNSSFAQTGNSYRSNKKESNKKNNTHTPEKSIDDLERNLSQKEKDYCHRLPESKQTLFSDWLVYLPGGPSKGLTLRSLFKHFEKYSAQYLTEQIEKATAGKWYGLTEKPNTKSTPRNKPVQHTTNEKPSTERQTTFKNKMDNSFAIGSEIANRTDLKF